MSDTDFSHCVMLMVLMSVESFSVIPPGSSSKLHVHPSGGGEVTPRAVDFKEVGGLAARPSTTSTTSPTATPCPVRTPPVCGCTACAIDARRASLTTQLRAPTETFVMVSPKKATSG